MKLIVALSVLPFFSNAITSFVSRQDIPDDTRYLATDDGVDVKAFDEGFNFIGTFSAEGVDKRSFEKRVSGTCTPMTNDDIYQIPGLPDLEHRADEKWGSGSRKLAVNMDDYPRSPANLCADDAGAMIIFKGEPDCKTNKQTSTGSLEGGKIILQNEEGTSIDLTTTVTESSTYGDGISINAKFTVSSVFEVGGEVTFHHDWTNTSGHAMKLHSDQKSMQRIEQPVDKGESCKIELETKSCSLNGTAKLDMLATGWLWFRYGHKTGSVDHPDDKHYYWALRMDSVIDKKDRASPVFFKTTGKMETNSHFKAVGCSHEASTS